MLKLPMLHNIKDEYLRDYFERIQKYLSANPILRGEWKFFELEIPAASTNLKVTHGLGFTPKDVIQTFKSGSGAVTWNYTEFNGTTIDITTTGPATVRFFLGRYA